MADYCRQCAKAHGFAEDDLAGLSKPEDTAAGLYAAVICEGCGFIQVDHEGRCISMSPVCSEGHGDAP